MVKVQSLLEEISYNLGFSFDFLNNLRVSSNVRNFYKKIILNKKNGGKRTILAPSIELKLIQNFVKEKYLTNVRTSDSCVSYKKGKNVIDNATPHLNSRHFLFIDVHNFFESINYNKLLNILKKELFETLNESDIEYLLAICTRDNILVQGCVTSPMLSNIYLYQFDMELEKYAKENNLIYTRYSDDITISSLNRINKSVFDFVSTKLLENGLNINEKKSHFSSYLENVKVTGIRIKNERKLSLTSDYKKSLKNSIYHLLNDSNTKEDANKVLGKLNYLKMVDLMGYNAINVKYYKNGKSTLDRIKELIKKDKNI